MGKCISAELAKLKIQRVCFGLCLDEETEKALTDAIDETQAEDVKRNVYGEWEYHSNPDCGIDPEDAFCSICGFYIDRTTVDNFDNYNFCPRCGADMRGDTE